MKSIKDLKGEIFLIHAKNRNMKAGKCVLIGIPTEMYKGRDYRRMFNMVSKMPSICCTSFGIDDDIDYFVTMCYFDFGENIKFKTPVYVKEKNDQCTEGSRVFVSNGALCIENCVTLDPAKLPQGYIGGKLQIFKTAEHDSKNIELITPPAYRNGLSQQDLKPSVKPPVEEEPLVKVIRHTYNDISEINDPFVVKRVNTWLKKGYKISQWHDTSVFDKLVTTVILVKEDK